MTHSIDCAALDERLSAYLEGELAPEERSGLEAHAAGCARCGALLSDIQRIRREAADLPDLAPSRDLWSGIAARIEAPVVALPEPGRRSLPAERRWRGGRLAAAAAALIVLTAGLTYTATRFALHHSAAPALAAGNGAQMTGPLAQKGSASGTPNGGLTGGANTPPRDTAGAPAHSASPEPAAGAPRSAMLASRTESPREDAGEVYGREIQQLHVILEQRRGQLDSSTVTIVERNLAVIDSAIAQSRRALARDPGSRFLTRQLNQVLGQKVELLRTVALLPART